MRLIISISMLVLVSCIGFRSDKGNSKSSNKFQNEFLRRVNKIRATGCKCGKTYMPPAEPLKWNNFLEKSAHGHARDMSKRKYFAHNSLSGKTIKNRLEDAGYSLSSLRAYAFGENIAAGQRSIEQVMKSWLKSEGHCKNIMNKNFRDIGVGEENYYWVQDFGMRLPAN